MLRGSTTELKCMVRGGPFLELLSARKPAGVDLFSFKQRPLERDTLAENV